jgi:FAD dependent oxidoreductase/NAD(P)-binding Rossmann-like domain
MRRRRFLEGCGFGLAGLLTANGQSSVASLYYRSAPREIKADVAILGGGLGGCAAAMAALRMGKTVVMTEPTDWIGGQLTSQAVPPDEHPWIESFGANASYMALRRGIRDYYRRHYPLTAEARAKVDLNPGTGGDNYIDVSSLPFTIPLGALVPRRIENLLPACKNLGVTHVTNGCYRLHPVEWGIGEAAGSLAAHALETGESPRSIRNDPKRLAEFQKRLLGQGVEIDWPRLIPR